MCHLCTQLWMQPNREVLRGLMGWPPSSPKPPCKKKLTKSKCAQNQLKNWSSVLHWDEQVNKEESRTVSTIEEFEAPPQKKPKYLFLATYMSATQMFHWQHSRTANKYSNYINQEEAISHVEKQGHDKRGGSGRQRHALELSVLFCPKIMEMGRVVDKTKW